MEQRYGEPGSLELNWRVRRFLPGLPEERDDRPVQEILEAQDFVSDAAVRQYWSVPERLLDLRWLSERPEERSEGAETADEFAQYLQAEHTLYRIVTTLGAWAGSLWRNTEKLRRDWAADEAWNRLWEKNGELVCKCAARRRNGALHEFSEDELIRLHRLLKDLPEPPATARTRPFRTAVERLRAALRETFGPVLEEEMSLRLFTGEDRQRNAEAAVDFCEKALEFFENALWRREQEAAAKLRKLAEYMGRAAPGLPPAEGDIWSEAYHRSLWMDIQTVADWVCDAINGAEGDPPVTVEELLWQVEGVWERLEEGSPVKTSLRDYIADGSRCAALLETEGGIRILAFSGFLDCEDTQTLCLLLDPTRDNKALTDAFRGIAAGLGAELAVHAPGVVDRMARYGVNDLCRLTAAATLRQELNAGVSAQRRKGFLKKSYACCERKILARMAELGTAAPAWAVLHVKFAPCMNCYAALRQWADGGGVRLTLDCPERV